MQTNEKILRSIIGSLENKVWLFWKVVLCRAVIFISIGLLFMAATSLWKRILVKVSIIYPESSHTLFDSIGCISIIYRESSNVLFSSNVYHSNAFGIPYKLRTEERQNLDSLTLTLILTIGQFRSHKFALIALIYMMVAIMAGAKNALM